LTMVFNIYETRDEAVRGALFTGMLPISALNNSKTSNQAQ
jgi:hypothetical protein